jgi:general secretion pathway protein N
VSRGLWIALLAAAFAIIVLTRLPASWVLPSASHGACAGVDGTVWNGNCTGLTVGHDALGDLTWQLQPARLLTGVLAGRVELAHGPVTGRADVALGVHSVTLRGLVADLPLDPAIIRELPRDLQGTAHIELELARLERRHIVELKGRIEAHDLRQTEVHVTPLGSYALTFPGGSGVQTATLQDLGGPLSVQGTLRLTPGGYDLEGLVAARPGAPPELVGSLQYLGSADSLGRRPFSMAGTF